MGWSRVFATSGTGNYDVLIDGMADSGIGIGPQDRARRVGVYQVPSLPSRGNKHHGRRPAEAWPKMAAKTRETGVCQSHRDATTPRHRLSLLYGTFSRHHSPGLGVVTQTWSLDRPSLERLCVLIAIFHIYRAADPRARQVLYGCRKGDDMTDTYCKLHRYLAYLLGLFNIHRHSHQR